MPRRFKSKIAAAVTSATGQEFENPTYEVADGQADGRQVADDKQTHREAEVKQQKRKQSEAQWTQALSTISAANKWISYETRKRPCKGTGPPALQRRDSSQACRDFHINLNKTICGILDQVEEEKDEEILVKPNTPVIKDKALIIYVAKISQGKNYDEPLDLEFMEDLIDNGADVDACDKYGQTLLHEASRAWQPDVARFLITKGADVNRPDKFGRTPLHMASAVNYPEMITLLIENGATLESETTGEMQTPCHFAARNDALDALKLLLKHDANIEARDYKKRTPMQLAAELDRSTTAKYLIEQGSMVSVCDESGLPALSLMIEKMTPVAKDALERLHRTDGPNRKQMFYLDQLEPATTGCDSFARSPMTIAVKNDHLDLLCLEPLKRLQKVKWETFGKQRHIFHLVLYLIFMLLWTVIALTQPRKDASPTNTTIPTTATTTSTNKYSGYRVWWRLLLDAISVLFTFYYIIGELYELSSAKKEHAQYCDWRIHELERDLVYAHPRWPEERRYIECEIEEVRSSSEAYFTDLWNLFDWAVYLICLACITVRVVAIYKQEPLVQPQLVAIAIILVWLRFLKLVRVFSALGPFVVMFGHIIDDTVKFLFLFIEFFIPFTIAFFVIFGGPDNAAIMRSKNQSADNWEKFEDLIYYVWQMVLVGDFDFAALQAVDKGLAYVLVLIFTFISAILLLNLFIAMMSNSFQNVYDNAKANALMQQASAVLAIESARGMDSHKRFQKYLQVKCAPLIEYWDDDMEGDDSKMEKVTLQIKDVVDEMFEKVDDMHGDIHGDKKKEEEETRLSELRGDMEQMAQRYLQKTSSMDRKIDDLSRSVNNLTLLMQKMVYSQQAAAVQPSSTRHHRAPSEEEETRTVTTGVSSPSQVLQDAREHLSREPPDHEHRSRVPPDHEHRSSVPTDNENLSRTPPVQPPAATSTRDEHSRAPGKLPPIRFVDDKLVLNRSSREDR